MGLDMYLERHTYVKRWKHMPPERLFDVTVSRGGQPYTPIKPERISFVIEQVGYWRKNYSVHEWLIQNVDSGIDDCTAHYVPLDKLQELSHYAENIGDHQTVAMLEPLIAEYSDGDHEGSFYYRASW